MEHGVTIGSRRVVHIITKIFGVELLFAVGYIKITIKSILIRITEDVD